MTSKRGTAAEWVERDAAVVWHGFTQMSTFGENDPIIVERSEGHELIDVNGMSYSSCWYGPFTLRSR